ncbi:MAG TPA: right-handed parallel beta-helix repeat-containing protein, partial [bacterium]|nr:right-handed parallel beta-helix repeat-containing protein [bacterium]
MPSVTRLLALFCLLLPTLTGPASARTWLVPAEVLTVTAGLDSAAAGDTVLVSCGTYPETGLTLPDGVTLRGETGAPGCVVLDGQGAAGILRAAHTGAGTRIEAITFRNGRGPLGGLTNFDRAGGAVAADSAQVDVTDCRFENNLARFGGAVGMRHATLVFTRCDFDSNAAFDSSWAAGGAIYGQRSDPVMTDCGFVGNTAFSVAIPGDGGGVFLEVGEAVLTDCDFLGNSSGAGGGAFYSFNFDKSRLIRCEFRENVSGGGAAAYVETSQPEFLDCLFVDNDAGNGGAIFCGQFGAASFTDCVFDSNSAVPFSGGACDIWQSSPTFLRCLFRLNAAQVRGGAVSVNFASGPSFTDCLFQGNSAQDGGALR